MINTVAAAVKIPNPSAALQSSAPILQRGPEGTGGITKLGYKCVPNEFCCPF